MHQLQLLYIEVDLGHAAEHVHDAPVIESVEYIKQSSWTAHL